MKATGAAAMLALACPAIAAGPSSSGVKGPPGIPFTCSDGRSLRIVYGDQGPRRTAKLAFDGGEAMILGTIPAFDGQRYASDAPPGERLIWATDGVQGWLLGDARETEAGESLAIATCRRAGWDHAALAARVPSL